MQFFCPAFLSYIKWVILISFYWIIVYTNKVYEKSITKKMQQGALEQLQMSRCFFLQFSLYKTKLKVWPLFLNSLIVQFSCDSLLHFPRLGSGLTCHHAGLGHSFWISGAQWTNSWLQNVNVGFWNIGRWQSQLFLGRIQRNQRR